MTSKMFRDEKANSNKVDYCKRILSERKLHAFKKYNSLYCTNRTSLENSFYARGYSIYTCSRGSYWNSVEGNRRLQKLIESYGSL